MNNQPLVSVLIPAYRAHATLPETLASLAAQTWEHWELIVVEDGCFDQTADLVQEFTVSHKQEVRLIRNPTNIGVGGARNQLLNAARGDFIAFLDADDLWTPDHLTFALQLIERLNADWHIGAMHWIDINGRNLRTNILPPSTALELLPDALLRHNFVLTSSTVYRSKVFADGLRFDPSLPIGEDLDLCIELARQGHQPVFGTEPTLRYRKHSRSTTANSIRFAEEFAKVYEKHLHNPMVDSRACQTHLKKLLESVIKMTWRTEPSRARAALARLHLSASPSLRTRLYALLLRVT